MNIIKRKQLALKESIAEAKSNLGVANFNLQQALNNLFVAQAAKAAADKAVSLAYAQGVDSLDILEGESTYVFRGCNEQVYPEISGTVAVSTLITSGARLNSGQILKWSDCTEMDLIDVNDVVVFVGTIDKGVISAKSVKKLKENN